MCVYIHNIYIRVEPIFFKNLKFDRLIKKLHSFYDPECVHYRYANQVCNIVTLEDLVDPTVKTFEDLVDPTVKKHLKI